MIILPNQRIAIMTPPKCGTNTLHNILGNDRWRGLCYVGPTPISPASYDRHVNKWPNEVLRFRKLVVVRHPLIRLVSMYLHLTVRRGGGGEAVPAFSDYAALVAAGGTVAPFSDALYTWNLNKWLMGVPADNILHTEHLMEELHVEGLAVERMPRDGRSYKAKPYHEFYTDETLAVVAPWAAPDCAAYGYTWPTSRAEAPACLNHVVN